MELHDRQAPHRVEERELPEPVRCGLEELPPPDAFDPVIEAFKKDVDRTLLIESLKRTPEQRSQRFLSFMGMAYELRRAGERSRAKAGTGPTQ
ncbi:MAG TPA: hypothetical protein VI454_09525 [Verrucomicrobiae bacterium]|jgi:hypothetical protein